jgi:hypothetical protein
LVAYTAAAVTVNEMQAKPFELLYLTTLSNQHLIIGYFINALDRFRGFFALIVGFAPFAIVSAVYTVLYNCSQFYPCALSFTVVLSGIMGFTVLAVNVIGICLLGAAFGVFLAAWWRNRITSTLIALMFSIVAMTLTYATPSFSLSELLKQNLIALPVIYVACAVFILLARPFARKAR